MGKTRLGINVNGGASLVFRQIVADQTGGFTVDPGIIEKLTFTIGLDESEEMDDRGRMVDVLETGQKLMIEAVMKQSRKSDIDILMGSKGKYYCGYYQAPLRDGNYQHLFIPIVRFGRNAVLPYGPEKRQLMLKGHILAPIASYTYPVSFPQYQDFDFSLVDNASVIVAPTTTMPVTGTHI